LSSVIARAIIAGDQSIPGDAVIRIMLSLSTVLIAVSSAFAGDRSQVFSDADIKGNYGLLAQGNSVVSGTSISFPAVIVGTLSSDGKGNLQGSGTVNPGGPVSGLEPGESVKITGTYDVDTDGTGDFTASAASASPSATSNSSHPPSIQLGGALVIASSDNEVQLVSTQTNRVLYTTLKKQRPPEEGFSNATLRGAWGFACHGTLVTSTEDPTAVEFPVAVIGLMTNDGHGKFSAEITANTNGVVSQESFSGLNGVAGDGTITATATGTDPLLAHLSGIIDNSQEFRLITIDPGRIVSCTFEAQGRRDEGRD
jgi:hypothetical protein